MNESQMNKFLAKLPANQRDLYRPILEAQVKDTKAVLGSVVSNMFKISNYQEQEIRYGVFLVL